jgi:hypothetical protein
MRPNDGHNNTAIDPASDNYRIPLFMVNLAPRID